MIRGINESKILTKDISCECKFKLDRRKYNLNQWWNNDKSRYKSKKVISAKKIIFGVLLCVIVKMENILQVLWIKLFAMKL